MTDNRTADTAKAIPTKQFFVSMLTRDISLADAILDLVDNCLDGALRCADGTEVDYSQHSVNIDLSAERFRIKDDCGGIPRHTAKEYAFKMGRDPDDERDLDTETIGMYGIGMKRAIFKMGRDAIVRTLYDGDAYEVPITSSWLDQTSWEPLPINTSTSDTQFANPGTVIEVTNLYPGVSRHMASDAFANELLTSIGEHFTFFIQKGFRIAVNDTPAKAVHVEVLVSEEDTGPAPYVFQKEIEGVMVSITVGLNTGRRLDEDDEVDFERNRSATTAGWTVFCNDRAVIVGDKGRLTGWGDGIPMYHGQFSVITGIVKFSSASADKLPITTTKRALDTSSDIWLEARTKMREGLRIWINYTNTWKNHPRSDQSSIWESATSLSLDAAVERVLTRDPTRKKDGGIEFNPQKKKVLPIPDTKKPSSRRIIFSRPLDEIKDISSAFFDRDDERPGVIGDKCFDVVLAQVRRQVGK